MTTIRSQSLANRCHNETISLSLIPFKNNQWVAGLNQSGFTDWVYLRVAGLVFVFVFVSVTVVFVFVFVFVTVVPI